MAQARAKAYTSPTLILLAFDWPDGGDRTDFLGFAVSRTPGFGSAETSWLPNRIGFDGPAPDGSDFPSNDAPIQKFLWWDARIRDSDRGRTFTYEVTPVAGSPGNMRLVQQDRLRIRVQVPMLVENGVGTYFNRAVVSSQSFVRNFGRRPTGDRRSRALAWLANGIERVIPQYLINSPEVEGAIYHLEDEEWVIPALLEYRGRGSMVFHHKTGSGRHEPTERAVERLADIVEFLPRTRATIMHNKFLVRCVAGRPQSVLMGSANFTTGGLSTQANLLHTFESPTLAALYLARKKLLAENKTLAVTALGTAWSARTQVGDCRVRVFFSPEPTDQREAIGTIIEAVRRARQSVLFCLFTPTDRALREAIFEAGDQGKMMFGLVNSISREEPEGDGDAAAEARVELYHRSRNERDVFAHGLYPRGNEPAGFWWENAQLGSGTQSQFPVYIHHKFIVIDGETNRPTIFTGSANMSNNSNWRNDENLLEITGSPRLGAIYLAEFLRLYEHYRARAQWQRWDSDRPNTYRLRGDSTWTKAAYRQGTPLYKSRVNMVR